MQNQYTIISLRPGRRRTGKTWAPKSRWTPCARGRIVFCRWWVETNRVFRVPFRDRTTLREHGSWQYRFNRAVYAHTPYNMFSVYLHAERDYYYCYYHRIIVIVIVNANIHVCATRGSGRIHYMLVIMGWPDAVGGVPCSQHVMRTYCIL